VFRRRCSGSRETPSFENRAGRVRAAVRRMTRPVALRRVSMSNRPIVRGSARTPSAAAENETRAPVIQRTTAMMARWDKGACRERKTRWIL